MFGEDTQTQKKKKKEKKEEEEGEMGISRSLEVLPRSVY